MLAITLDDELAQQVNLLAEQRGQRAEEMVQEAVRQYLADARQERIQREQAAFDEQREHLLAHYAGDYVAIHEGEVIDHGPDLRTLHLRVFAKLGHAPVLLKRVSTEPEREWVFRSPRLEQNT